MDAPSDATVTDLEATIVASAEMAKACGQSSGLIDNILKGTGKSRVDWRNEMRAMLTSASNDDYTYRRPSRRFIAQGTYLPSLYSEGLGPVLIAIDSSASMSQRELSRLPAKPSRSSMISIQRSYVSCIATHRSSALKTSSKVTTWNYHVVAVAAHGSSRCLTTSKTRCPRP